MRHLSVLSVLATFSNFVTAVFEFTDLCATESLLVFTLGGNVAHSFLIKSLGEIIEWIQIQLLTVNYKINVLYDVNPKECYKICKGC